MLRLFGVSSLALSLACAAGEPPRRPVADAGPSDAEVEPDLGLEDAGTEPDLGTEPDMNVDMFVPVDEGVPDAGVPGAYLDRCNVPGDCASGRCIDDRGSTRFCTRTCSVDGECASDHLCAGGQCQPNDVGQLCDMAADCTTTLCAGNAATGVGECTRRCTNASDCPSGFACGDAGGVFVCVDIERPCASCGTGVCLEDLGQGTRGCTSTCRGPADCPRTLPGLEYSCTSGYCIPSTLALGPDPMGATCRFGSGGANLCRSGVCVTDDFGAQTCTQVCDERTTCSEGFACVPSDDGAGGTVTICQRAGAEDIGGSCIDGRQCTSGICEAGVCSRLCTDDRLCPTGGTCTADIASGGDFFTCHL